MTKKRQDFEIFQGETKRIKAAIVDESNAAKTLTGATVVWRSYRHTEDDTAAIEETGTIISINGTDDGVQIDLAVADTENLTPDDYYHECRVTDSGGNEEVVFIGNMKLRLSKTN